MGAPRRQQTSARSGVTCQIIVLALWSLVAIHAGGCRVNAAPVAPAPPVQGRATTVWAAEGVQVVQHGLPMFLVDGRYWHWHEGEWHVWRDLGWHVSRPPSALTRMDETPGDGAWWNDSHAR